jgi:hypothetical protein
VLIIEPTKVAAQRTAKALAEEIEEDNPECAALAALASTRLDAAHPLVEVLRPCRRLMVAQLNTTFCD